MKLRPPVDLLTVEPSLQSAGVIDDGPGRAATGTVEVGVGISYLVFLERTNGRQEIEPVQIDIPERRLGVVGRDGYGFPGKSTDPVVGRGLRGSLLGQLRMVEIADGIFHQERTKDEPIADEAFDNRQRVAGAFAFWAACRGAKTGKSAARETVPVERRRGVGPQARAITAPTLGRVFCGGGPRDEKKTPGST